MTSSKARVSSGPRVGRQRYSQQPLSWADRHQVTSEPAAGPEILHYSGENPLGRDFSQSTFERHATILGDGCMSQPMYAHQRAMIAQQLQMDYGNQYVQRLVKHIQRQREEIVQTKLEVGPAGDKYEQEADQVTKQVVGMIASGGEQVAQRQDLEEEELQMKPLVQRQDLEEEELQMMPQVQRQEEEEKLQMKLLVQRQLGAEGGGVEPEVEKSIQKARGQGQPLPENVRSSMEGAFGADFSGVRVHTGAESDALNDSVGARAFTTGQDIFFGWGEYNPGSSAGKEVLAHELTHVVQQNGSTVQRHQQQGDQLAVGASSLPGG